MTGLVLTPRQIFKARAAHLKAKRSRRQSPYQHMPAHGFYAYVDRTSLHPVEYIDSHDGVTCLRVDFRMGEGLVGPIADQLLTFDLSPDVEPIPADAAPQPRDWRALDDRTVIEDESLWPQWPRLFMHRPGYASRGGKPLGWILSDDKPRGGKIRIRRKGSDQNLPFKSIDHMLDSGWKIDRREHR